MKKQNVHALSRAMLGLGCIVGVSEAVAAPKPPTRADTGDATAGFVGRVDPQPSIGVRTTAPSGSEGGIAGSTLIWWNGDFDTGEAAACTVAGTRSTAQNTAPVCLGLAGISVVGFRGADDFTLTQCAEINRVTVYQYTTNATTITLNGGQVFLHSGQPWATSSNVVASSSVVAEPPSFTTTYRTFATAFSCARRVQQIVFDTSAWPVLPPGNYWISFSLSSSTGAGFTPFVTTLGQQGKPGANAMNSDGNVLPTTFSGLLDTGTAGCVGQPPAPGARQDWPFRLDGVLGCGACPGDVNSSGTVDVDDLVQVILSWGQPDSSGVVDVDDLVGVILGWGPCTAPPAPGPIATGACCTGTSCNIVTFATCVANSGVYFGDGTNCTITGGCQAPASDECTGATTVSLGNTTVNTTLATNSPEPVMASCAFQSSRDVWLAFQTVSGQPYSATTTGTPAGPGNVADTVMVVYSGTCGALVTQNCNDDIAAIGGPSTCTFTGNGEVMFIRVGTYVATQPEVVNGGSMVVGISSP